MLVSSVPSTQTSAATSWLEPPLLFSASALRAGLCQSSSHHSVQRRLSVKKSLRAFPIILPSLFIQDLNANHASENPNFIYAVLRNQKRFEGNNLNMI